MPHGSEVTSGSRRLPCPIRYAMPQTPGRHGARFYLRVLQVNIPETQWNGSHFFSPHLSFCVIAFRRYGQRTNFRMVWDWGEPTCVFLAQRLIVGTAERGHQAPPTLQPLPSSASSMRIFRRAELNHSHLKHLLFIVGSLLHYPRQEMLSVLSSY
ncbi:hypothetical protein CEXT_53051 [Caerostris extrusa]|uniref:Uncharacterized protein n=1 Tax=Caerostris extrusa TaxID=172846 RepID=A0AAV4XV03_CAEEX|nr:hypothetical protein CEXT_53051 [Caerostris extrusa]